MRFEFCLIFGTILYQMYSFMFAEKNHVQFIVYVYLFSAFVATLTRISRLWLLFPRKYMNFFLTYPRLDGKTELCLSEFCTFFEEEFVRQAFSLSIVWSSSCQYISGCRCQWAKGISSKSFHSDMKITMFEQLKMEYLT